MQLIDQLVGKKVTVFSLQGEAERQDVGVLEATDGTWIKVRKAEGEVMLFCVYHLRLIKPFDPL